MNSVRTNKGKGKRLGVKRGYHVYSHAVTGSSVHMAGSNALPRLAAGSAPKHELNSPGAPGLQGSLSTLLVAQLPAPTLQEQLWAGPLWQVDT